MEKLPGHTYDFKVLLRVYISLVLLAGGMVAISRFPADAILGLEWIDLHVLQGLVILGLSLVMTTIVAGFLMGLKYEKNRLNTLVFLGNFAFLALFITFTWADINFRGLLDPSFEKQLNWESPVTKANENPAAHHEGGEEGHDGEAGEHAEGAE